MDDRALRLALESLLDEPTLKSAHRASLERGLADLRAQRLTSDERDYLCYLIEHYGQSNPSPDPVAALIAAFQDKLPTYDPAAVATAVHHALAQQPATLNGAPVTITMNGDTYAHQANLAIGNQVGGNLVQVTVTIPIPDVRFDALLATALRTHEHEKTRERLINAAQQIESDRLLNLRLKGFVGRVTELAAIREHIETMRSTGGYVLIKAAAGEGKSSSIAKLIQEAGIAQTPHHFIALTTGREYQLGLLRAVAAQLILKHNLTVSYFPEESYPAMKGEFVRILDELSKQGIEETIYLDGLDQLQPEIDGSRDLSFLPPQPPPGIVMVLGSRPDETLKPLEILHRVDYDLPPLSEADALALWRSVQPAVADGLLHDLYAALKGNALFVHLAANTMRDQSVVDATSLIRQIEQNPSNLFGITLDRIKGRSRSQWDVVWKPMLVLLLVAQEPLRLDVVGDLLEHDHDTMQDAVRVLGGLVSQGIDQRVALHHLLFRDYLAAVVFNAREVKRWQQRLADWCSVDLEMIWGDHSDPIEQARRVYARYHYITHLSLAENWPTLWQVLDAGDYGEQKTRFDPSTRLYALDLDRGRESAINAGQSTEEHLQNLPRLWKYSLLRTSLTSRVDQWPDDLFVVLVMLGRTQEALDRIDLCTDHGRQIQLWKKILVLCEPQYQSTIIILMHQVASHLSGIEKFRLLGLIATTIATLGAIDQAHQIAQSITDLTHRFGAFRDIAITADKLGNREQALEILNHALIIAQSIDDPKSRAEPLYAIATTIATLGAIDQAHQITCQIDLPELRDDALAVVVTVTATFGDIDRALAMAQPIEGLWQQAHALRSIAITTTHGSISRALVIAQSINDPIFRADAFGTIATIVATLGDINQALAIAQSIDSWSHRSHVFRTIAATTNILGNRAKAISILDHARQLAQSINDRWQKADALKAIATTAATFNDQEQAIRILDQALAIAQSIKSLRQRADTLRDIAIIAATIGSIDQAFAIAQSIDHPKQCVDTLGVITITATAAYGNGQPAITIFNKTRSIIQSINYPEQRADALGVIATTTATFGEINRALAIAQSIDDSERHADTLRAIATTIATFGEINRALAIAQSINNRWQRADALKAIATTAAAFGDIDHALVITKFINEFFQQTNALRSIAITTATFGDINRALTIAQSINDLGQQADTLKVIATITSTLGDTNRALAIAQSINDLVHRVDVLCFLALIATKLGNREKGTDLLNYAIVIAQSIVRPERCADAFKVIAITTATLGDISQALAIAQSIVRPERRADAFKVIAITTATLGDISQALAIAQSITQPEQCVDALGTIAARAADTYGNDQLPMAILEKAHQIAQSIAQPERRADALGTIATTTATLGDIDRAIAIVQSIVSPDKHDHSLRMIVKTVRSITRILAIIQRIWFHSKTSGSIWGMTPIIAPLLNDYPWLGTAILKEEAWVNEQLKRLG